MRDTFPPIILASTSPRRRDLLQSMGLNFRVVAKEIDESYPPHLSPVEIAVFIAEKKAKAFDELVQDEIVITADTIVCIDGIVMGKPKDKLQAFEALSLLSGKKHEVITGVSLLYRHELHTFYEVSEVYFRSLTADQIHHYLAIGQSLDKAGGYGAQEWIGLIGISKIHGSHTNILGLPTARLYEELCLLCGDTTPAK